nr:hypothetical protein Iba_chr09bCG14600 [Ipomoea batatas]
MNDSLSLNSSIIDEFPPNSFSQIESPPNSLAIIYTPSSVSDKQGSSCGGVFPLIDGSWSAIAELSSDGVASLSRSASQYIQLMAAVAWKDSPVSGNGVPPDGYGGGFSSW